MKYELQYDGLCFDFLWQSLFKGEIGLSELMEKEFDVAFVNKDKCGKEFMDLITKWHEQGDIKPNVGTKSTEVYP